MRRGTGKNLLEIPSEGVCAKSPAKSDAESAAAAASFPSATSSHHHAAHVFASGKSPLAKLTASFGRRFKSVPHPISQLATDVPGVHGHRRADLPAQFVCRPLHSFIHEERSVGDTFAARDTDRSGASINSRRIDASSSPVDKSS